VKRWVPRAAENVARHALGRAQSMIPRAERGTVILAYHLVDAGTDSVVDLPEPAFRAQLEELSRTAAVCSLPTVLDAPASPQLRVVVTFDDAFENFATRALPILEELAIPATLYVPVAFIEGTRSSPLSGCTLPALSWSTLRDLSTHPLVHIGSHSYSHRDLRTLSPWDRLDDLERARQTLEDRLGIEVADFCYPQAKWSPSVEVEVRAVYRSATIAGGGCNPTLEPYRLQRRPIRRTSPVSFSDVLTARWLLEESLADRIRRRS